jgi:hypothetical protein
MSLTRFVKELHLWFLLTPFLASGMMRKTFKTSPERLARRDEKRMEEKVASE